MRSTELWGTTESEGRKDRLCVVQTHAYPVSGRTQFAVKIRQLLRHVSDACSLNRRLQAEDSPHGDAAPSDYSAF
jgi:hypothetical protein